MPESFDVIRDLDHIEEDGLMISESLTESLSVIAQARGVSINVIASTFLWDGIKNYNKKMKSHLTSSIEKT